jgi:hypothetical protein
MALQGDMAGSVRFLEQLIEHNQKLGFVTGRDTTRLLLAELYILVLQSKELPPFAVIRKNLRFLIVTKLSGWNKALALVLATRDFIRVIRPAEGRRYIARHPLTLGKVRCP